MEETDLQPQVTVEEEVVVQVMPEMAQLQPDRQEVPEVRVEGVKVAMVQEAQIVVQMELQLEEVEAEVDLAAFLPVLDKVD
jgi:hypothetical protein